MLVLGLTASLRPEQASYAIGDAVWLEITLRNPGPTPYTAQLYPWNADERGGLSVTVTDPAGAVLPDPYHRPESGWASNGGLTATAPAGGSGAMTVDLSRFAWIDRPGLYHVVMDFPLETGPVRLTTDVELTDPADLRATVLAHPQNDWMQGRSASLDYFEGLGHARFVPILEELAGNSVPPVQSGDSDEVDHRAHAGLAACPCRESTAALLRLWDRLPDPTIRRDLGIELLRRIPGAPRASPSATWFASQSWDPAFDEELRERARGLLREPPVEPWDYTWATWVMERLALPTDEPLIADAAGRALKAGLSEAGLQRLAVEGSAVPTPPDAALLLELDRSRPGEPPAEEKVLRAVTSGLPALVAAGLRHAPAHPSPALIAAVVPQLASADDAVAGAVSGFLALHPDPAFVEPTLAGFGTARDDLRVQRLWYRCSAMQVPDRAVAARVVAALSPGRPTASLAEVLAGLVGCRVSSAPLADAEIPALKAAWTRALAAPARGPITAEPGLVPATWTCW